MAKKKYKFITELLKDRRNINNDTPTTPQYKYIEKKGTMPPCTYGYRKVTIVRKNSPLRKDNDISIVSARKKASFSFSLFVAGGKDIDEKVAKANAKLVLAEE